ncbi:hypothetical protein PO909_031725, partial [Leuciscus waleckii]
MTRCSRRVSLPRMRISSATESARPTRRPPCTTGERAAAETDELRSVASVSSRSVAMNASLTVTDLTTDVYHLSRCNYFYLCVNKVLLTSYPSS